MLDCTLSVLGWRKSAYLGSVCSYPLTWRPWMTLFIPGTRSKEMSETSPQLCDGCAFLQHNSSNLLGFNAWTFLLCAEHDNESLGAFVCPYSRTDACFGALKFEAWPSLLVLLTPSSRCRGFYPHLLLTKPRLLSFRLFPLHPSIHPSEDQKVAGAPLMPAYEVHTDGSHSLSTAHPLLLFTRPQHQTRVAFFSKTNDMVSSLCQSHLLTLTGF